MLAFFKNSNFRLHTPLHGPATRPNELRWLRRIASGSRRPIGAESHSLKLLRTVAFRSLLLAWFDAFRVPLNGAIVHRGCKTHMKRHFRHCLANAVTNERSSDSRVFLTRYSVRNRSYSSIFSVKMVFLLLQISTSILQIRLPSLMRIVFGGTADP
jgi:hypothetical protein